MSILLCAWTTFLQVSEGLDFADANARGVIIVGIPFPAVKDTKVECNVSVWPQSCLLRFVAYRYYCSPRSPVKDTKAGCICQTDLSESNASIPPPSPRSRTACASAIFGLVLCICAAFLFISSEFKQFFPGVCR